MLKSTEPLATGGGGYRALALGDMALMNVCSQCNRKLSACNSAGVKYFSTHSRGLSDATVLQTVAKRETVEADASTVEKGGTMALRSLGRHTILQAGRPHPPPTPRPLPAELAVGECNGRAPRVWRADARAWRPVHRLGLDARPHPGCPTAFSGPGRGFAALLPHVVTGPGGPEFAGANSS